MLNPDDAMLAFTGDSGKAYEEGTPPVLAPSRWRKRLFYGGILVFVLFVGRVAYGFVKNPVGALVPSAPVAASTRSASLPVAGQAVLPPVRGGGARPSPEERPAHSLQLLWIQGSHFGVSYDGKVIELGLGDKLHGVSFGMCGNSWVDVRGDVPTGADRLYVTRPDGSGSAGIRRAAGGRGAVGASPVGSSFGVAK